MAPRLRVLAGTSPDTMVPISSLVNTGVSHPLSSPLFEGSIAAHIKGMTDEQGRVRDSEYFRREDKAGITWSIQVQGRFLVPHSADDILFGNTFDRPLKLPWGSSAVLKFMHYIDPTLEHDLTSSTKPWALSPLIATMPNFVHTRIDPNAPHSDVPEFPPSYSITDDSKDLHLTLVDLDDRGRPIPTITTSPVSPPRRRSNSSQLSLSPSSSSPSSSPELPVSTLRRPPSALSSHSAGSAGSGSSVSIISSGSSGSGRSATSKISGTGSQRLKQAMRKVHLRPRGRDANSSDSDEDRHGTDSGSRNRRRRRERERELMRLDASSAARRAHFASKAKRSDVWFGPNDVITTDFCYGFINFAPSLALQLPGGLSFDLMKYWDGQPVRFVCCERAKEGASSEPWGRIFWCVAIEMVDGDESDS